MTQDEKRQYWLTFNSFQQSREKHFSPLIFKAIRSQYNTFIKSYSSGKRPDLALMDITAQPINDVLKPLYLDAGIVYGAKVRAHLNSQKARMPIGFNERMVALMQAYFQTDILNTSIGITDTTISLIQEVLSKAAAEGLSNDQIIAQLENTELSRIRARLIARTETVTAANQGAEFAAADTGLLLNKEWIATMDSRTRHDHRSVNGQVIAFKEYHTLPGGITMKKPGEKKQKDGTAVPAKEVCNCRCVEVYIPVRDANGRLVSSGETFSPVKPVRISTPEFIPYSGTALEAKDQLKKQFKEKLSIDLTDIKYHNALTLDKINKYSKKVDDLLGEYEPANVYKGSAPVVQFSSTYKTFGYIQTSYGGKLLDVNFGHTTDTNRAVADRVPSSIGHLQFRTFASKSKVDPENLEYATIVHEFGHLITMEKQMHLVDQDSRLIKYWKELKSIKLQYSKEIKPLIRYDSAATQNDFEQNTEKLKAIYLGDYASTNMNEFMAEAFTEYKLNSNPSKYAMLAGKLIDKYFKRK